MLSNWPLKVVRTLLYPPLLRTANLWRMPTDPHMYYDMISGRMPSTVVLEASQLCTDLSDMD